MKAQPQFVLGLVTAIAVAGGSLARGGSQMFPTKRPARGLSAYLVGPTEGMTTLPEGWKLRKDPSFGNSAIADESLEANSKIATCTTTSFPLPQSDYHVSVLVRGQGQARLAGSRTWKDFRTPRNNYYSWIEVGEIEDSTTFGVEVRSLGGRNRLNYGGLLAEGQIQPVAPVSDVAAKIKAGQPTTIVLLGDSVTENWGGTGGGSSCFEKGNPGLLREFLEQTSGTHVDYFTHRLPATWPEDRELANIPTVEIDGRKCYDSRIEKDRSKRIHLINLGKGGAASNWGWSRMPDRIVESDYFDAALPKEQRKPSVRFGLAHYKPDLVIINFGTNDVNAVHPNWLVEDYLFHMKALATNIQQRFGSAVVLSTPHKWTRGVHLTTHRQPAMVDALRTYCKTTGIALADVYNEYGPGEYDGIHPGDAGHQHIADAYIKAVAGQTSEPKVKCQTVAANLKRNGDGTVTDTTTSLIWTRNADLANGERDAAGTEAFVARFNADAALGHKDWRLPSREELLKLVDPARRSPALPEMHPFESVSGWYRTSTPDWGVDMDTGVPWSTGEADTKTARIWLVRGAE
jgi:lysophospholipase L1-like esterase